MRYVLRPFTAQYRADPFPLLAHLRADRPVYRDDELGVWVVTRYDDVRRVLLDPRTFSSAVTLAPTSPLCDEAMSILAAGMTVTASTVDADDPVHTRVRQALITTFAASPRRVLRYEPMIRAEVRRLAACLESDLDSATTVDLMASFTWELPLRVVLHLLGVPDADVEKVKRWGDGQAALLWGTAGADEQVRCARGLVEFWNYCRALVAARVAEPGDDVPSDLLAYRDGDDQLLGVEEIAGICFSFLAAGHETTAHLLSNGVHRLLRTGGAWARLARDPRAIPAAVEEALRFEPSIFGWQRLTTTDVTLAGTRVPAGERLLLMIGSANHDETRFDEPEEFHIGRREAREHLTFGLGAHYCIGASLARLEARVALEELTRRFADLRLAAGFAPGFVPNVALRGLTALPVTRGRLDDVVATGVTGERAASGR